MAHNMNLAAPGKLRNVIQTAPACRGVPEGRLIQALQVEEKLWTKGTASAVPHCAWAVEGFRVCVRARIFGQNQYDCVLISTQNQYEYCVIFEFSRRLFSPCAFFSLPG